MSETLLPRLYGITPRLPLKTLLPKVEEAFGAGLRLLQVRLPDTAPEELLGAVQAIMEIKPQGALVIVNNSVPVAFIADGVHLGEEDCPVKDASSALGSGRVVGYSGSGNVTLARYAAEEGADYVVFGPCWETPTKPGKPTTPLSIFKERMSVPVYGIGGITPDNCREVLNAGAYGVAAIRGVFEGNVGKSVEAFLEASG